VGAGPAYCCWLSCYFEPMFRLASCRRAVPRSRCNCALSVWRECRRTCTILWEPMPISRPVRSAAHRVGARFPITLSSNRPGRRRLNSSACFSPRF
jgi:hypothetical protein